MKTKEPPCTEPYARWCERSANQLMVSLLPDFGGFVNKEKQRNHKKCYRSITNVPAGRMPWNKAKPTYGK